MFTYLKADIFNNIYYLIFLNLSMQPVHFACTYMYRYTWLELHSTNSLDQVLCNSDECVITLINLA